MKLTDIVQPNVALKTNQLTLDLTCVADPANVLNDKGMELWNYATGTKHVAGGLYVRLHTLVPVYDTHWVHDCCAETDVALFAYFITSGMYCGSNETKLTSPIALLKRGPGGFAVTRSGTVYKLLEAEKSMEELLELHPCLANEFKVLKA